MDALINAFSQADPAFMQVYQAVLRYLAPLLAPQRERAPHAHAYCLVGEGVEKLRGGTVAAVLSRLMSE